MNRNDPYNPSNDNRSSIDFEKLCRSIDKTVAQISKAVGQGLGEAGEAIGSAINQAVEKSNAAKATARPVRPPVVPHTSAQTTTPVVRFDGYAPPTVPPGNIVRKRYRSTVGLNVSGGIMTTLGALGTMSFGMSALIAVASPALFAFAGIPATAMMAGGAVCAVIAVLSGWLMGSGIKRLTIASRFNALKRILGDREACSFDELSAQLHQSKKRTIADARKMMRYGLLPEGHIDDECTSLMTTNESYQLYRQVQRDHRRSIAKKRAAVAAESQKKAAIAAANGALPPEAREFIDAGSDYLDRMRNLDASIDDAAVSAKIEAIEDVVDRMIARVKDEPSVVDLLNKLMDYYLPTTVKLLKAYDDLEKQPVQGDNIAGSRQEIERTLEVLRDAYEKLLDETYRDMSLDVSADISVLNAILAQEGLTRSPFDEDSERTHHDDEQ